MTGKSPSERQLVFLVGAVQFVNVLDFMMVMPLGPDFARALDIPVSRLGLVGGVYTAAAAVSGRERPSCAEQRAANSSGQRGLPGASRFRMAVASPNWRAVMSCVARMY